MALTRPTAAQFRTTKVDFTDTIIRINSGETGANTNDIGIIFERGSHTNAAIVWDESDDAFRLIGTTETGNNSTSNINISSHHNLHIGTLTSAGITYPSSDGTSGQVLATNGSGTLSFANVTATPGGSDTQIQYNSSSALAGSANLTYNGTTLTLSGDSVFSGGLFKFSIPDGSLGTTTSEVDTLQIFQATGSTDAFQSFHINGDYAVHFGLDGTTNDLFVGGWSMGANKYKIWHAGNDGTGSGLDADTVDGYNPSSSNTGNTIVLRDSNGDFSANIITATSTSARYADLAENYLADKIYPIGTVLMIGGSAEITIAVKDSSPVIGTVSENPAYLMNNGLVGDYVTPVAYIGRVPCRVVGYIRKGTRLILSNTPGVACAALSNNELDYQAVGIALEDYNNDSEGLIEILVGR